MMTAPTLAELRDWLTERREGWESVLIQAESDRITEEVERAQQQLACVAALLRLVETQGRDTLRLLQFAGAILREHRGREVNDVGGDTIQEAALAAGLLETRTVTAACGEVCLCAEWDDFPQDCHFLSALGKAAMSSLPPNPEVIR